MTGSHRSHNEGRGSSPARWTRTRPWTGWSLAPTARAGPGARPRRSRDGGAGASRGGRSRLVAAGHHPDGRAPAPGARRRPGGGPGPCESGAAV